MLLYMIDYSDTVQYDTMIYDTMIYDTMKYDTMKYDTIKVIQYNINYINRYKVRCDGVMSVYLHTSYKTTNWYH